MLEWAGEQATEITTELINREFLPTDTNADRGVQNLEFVLQQMHTALMALTSYEANDIVANSPAGVWTNGMMTGVVLDGMMTGVLLDGTKVGNKRMTHL